MSSPEVGPWLARLYRNMIVSPFHLNCQLFPCWPEGIVACLSTQSVWAERMSVASFRLPLCVGAVVLAKRWSRRTANILVSGNELLKSRLDSHARRMTS